VGALSNVQDQAQATGAVMSVRFKCSHCDATLSAPDRERLLKPVVCPSCKNRFLPQLEAPALMSPIRTAAAPIVTRSEHIDSDLEFLLNEPARHESTAPLPEQLFYKLDSAKVTLKEYWWGSPFNPLLLIAFLLKLFRVRTPGSSDDPPVKSLEPFEAALQDFPPDVRDEFRPLVAELNQLGFVNPVCHVIHDGFHKTTIHWVSMRHESGRAIVRCQRRFWRSPNRPRKYLFPTFITSFSDGTYLVSTSAKADMLWPQVVELHRNRKADATTLWNEHAERLENQAALRRPRPVRDQQSLQAVLDEYHDVVTKFHVERGVFAPMSTAEDARARSAAPEGSPVASGPVQDMAYADVYDALQLQLNKQQTWMSFLLLLGVSLIAFAALGAFAWSGKMVAMLIPVLLFHEAGHYVAMKLSGYRNLKMFFIPMFGAAVMAESFNVPSWKKVFVSLAGPVPGIVLGIGLGIISLVRDIGWMHELSLMLLILNGVNLLPILPFDGGWVVHALLFSRHFGLDVAFRVIAALLLLFISALSGGGLMIGLGVFMLLGAQTAYKLGTIAQTVKPRLTKALVEEDTLSRDTVNVIAREIDERFKDQPLTVKARATLTKNVFEMIKCPAPGVLASLGFGGVYLGSILAALIVTGVLVVGKHANFGQLMNVAAEAPTTPLPRDSMKVAEGANVVPSNKEVTIVAECADAKTASDLFAELEGQVPPTGTLRLIGQTLLLGLPAEDDAVRTQWTGMLEPLCKSVVVDSEVFSVPLSLVCIAPSAEVAETIVQQFNEYSGATYEYEALISPWCANPVLTEEHKQARRTLRLLQEYHEDPVDDKKLDELYEQREAASRRGDKAAVEKLDAETQAIYKARQQRHIDSVKSRDDVNPSVIEIFARQPVYPEGDWDEESEEVQETPAQIKYRQDRAAWCNELAVHFGQIPENADGSGRIDRYGSKLGYASNAGLLMRFNSVRFSRPVDGIPSFAEWLYAQKCVDLKYRMGDDFGMLEE